MRIAFVSEADPTDRAAFSGMSYQFLQMILGTGATVEIVAPIVRRYRMQALRLASIPYRLSGYGVAWPKHPFLLRAYGRVVDEAVERLKPDIVFSPGSHAIAYSSFRRPTVFWTDAPFGAFMDYYPWPQYQKLTAQSRRHGLEADTRALRNSFAGLFLSSWGREAAISVHHADPAHVHVLALPGSLGRWPLDDVRAMVPGRLQSPWKILFSGVEWQRKGGDRAIAILNELTRLGQPCELDIAGVVPPPYALAAAQFPVRVHGRLNLNDQSKRDFLAGLVYGATYLLVPTNAEALGLVFCEALAAGVPPVGTDTGGVPDAILDGKTGFLIGLDEKPHDTAQRLIAGAEPAAYAAMAETGWRDWLARFSKEAIVKKLGHILEAAASSSPVPTQN